MSFFTEFFYKFTRLLQMKRSNIYMYMYMYMYIYVCVCVCVRGGIVHVPNRTVHGANSKFQWSSLFPWSGDFGVNRACACNYFIVWNALGKGSDLIFSSFSAGMFPWQRCMVCVSRWCCFNVICLFIVVSITVANEHTFYILKRF